MKKKSKKRNKSILVIIIITLVFISIINIVVVKVADPLIVTTDKAYELSSEEGGFDCILVLGASVSQYGPSPILANRLGKGMELFAMGVSNIMLLSGDNGTIEYNEVQAMKEYVLRNGMEAGLTANNVYLDYAGFSTYYSAVRSKEIFGAKRVVIVTQRYHLYRAVYIAKMIGLDVIGVAAEDVTQGLVFRGTIREIPARVKDFFLVLFKYTPGIMGDPVPLEYPSTQ
jgi:vancomycin permeability regulator SanA